MDFKEKVSLIKKEDSPGNKNQELKNIPDFILRVLHSRGFSTVDSIQNFLYPQVSNLTDPFKLKGMVQAVERLYEALQKQEIIAIYGDYDLDGTFGLTLLYEGLKQMGFKNLVPIQPFRHHDGYGFHSKYVTELKEKFNVSLILTVDVGITAMDACCEAKNLHVDVIITDHHLPQGGELPECLALINPNANGDDSGLNYLCGAGVGFYLIRALRKYLIDRGLTVALDLKDLLPYLAIAAITDMVPLVGDNRLWIKFAFDGFKKVQNIGLLKLLEKLNLNQKKLDTEDIGIKLAPKINALGRLEKDRKPMELMFLTESNHASQYADFLLQLNTKRRELQDEGIKQVKNFIDGSNFHEMVKQDGFLFYYSPLIHPGVTGLIANHFMNELQLPCLIGSWNEEHKTVLASGRMPESFVEKKKSLVDLMELLKSSECDGGGHACAVGFEFSESQAEVMRFKMKDYFKVFEKSLLTSELPALQFEPEEEIQLLMTHLSAKVSALKYDVEIKWKEIHFKNYLWLEFLEPFGVGFEEPKFLLRNVSFLQMSLLKQKHFKLVAINSETFEKVDFLLFNPNPRQKKVIADSIEGLDLVIKIKRDKFRNQNKVQILVEDLVKHECKDLSENR